MNKVRRGWKSIRELQIKIYNLEFDSGYYNVIDKQYYFLKSYSLLKFYDWS